MCGGKNFDLLESIDGIVKMIGNFVPTPPLTLVRVNVGLGEG